MSETVFVFGAGASAECGAPVMKSFLDVARKIYLGGGAGHATAAFETVFTGIAALNDVYAKATIDTDNLEAVFAAFEMAVLFGRLRRFDDPRALAGLPDAIKRVIVETLEQTVSFHISSRSGREINLDAPHGYGDLIHQIPKTPADLDRQTFITFNYDLAFDFSLRYSDIRVDYGVVPGASRTPGHAFLLKLHGSVNWTECPNCQGGIGVYDLHKHVKDLRRPNRPFIDEGQRVRLRVANELPFFEHCNELGKSAGVPLLVPPTWSKAEHHRKLETVWQHAARELADARNIIVIGYSLPETDAFFRYLYALGTVSDTRIERFWVVDKDDSEETKKRFQSMLGPTAFGRFKYLRSTFYDAVTTPGEFRSFVSRLG